MSVKAVWWDGALYGGNAVIRRSKVPVRINWEDDMTHWTIEDLATYMDKQKAFIVDDVPDEGPESKLQGKIVKWAKERGYPCLSFRQSTKARGFLSKGWPDITLVLPQRVLFIECKSAAGSLRKEQKEMALMFFHLGHKICKIKSFRRFLEIVNGQP